MLEIEALEKRFGGLKALAGVSFSVEPGDFVGLIGPNGSGKTTLINCVSGLYTPDAGLVRFGGRVVSGLEPHRIHHLGIGRTFQITKVFRRLGVLDNLRVPALAAGTLGAAEIAKRAARLLAEVRLEEQAHLTAGELSGGQQKLLELAMVLMTDPQLLLLDEPFGGVHPELRGRLGDYLSRLNRQGRTIVLVSHEMSTVFSLCRRLVVLDRGAVLADGRPEEVRANERVIDAYLGGQGGA